MSELCLSQVANLLRPVSRDLSNGKGKLCLSTVYLQKLNKSFDENVPEDLTSSFHQTDAKATFHRDLQFLLDLVKCTVALKITSDIQDDENNKEVNLRRFKNIKALELHKLDLKNVFGIQKLRPQIQEITCKYNLEKLKDILEKCGGDESQKNLWSELKQINFSRNRILEIDGSLELTPWLHTLDLSYNQLTSVDFYNNLPNLKKLNLSFNKLEKVPRFKGQICKRLQFLFLNNNFIEDLSGLMSLSTLLHIDLNQNCLMDHKVLLSVSHLPSLYFLNLLDNPISFHPNHRTITCNYLNKSTISLKVVLDNVPLNKIEKSLAGSLYPINQSSLASSNTSSQNSLEGSVQERKKVRNVTIREEGMERKKKILPMTPRSTAHLEMKKQIEQLRQQYGENWLYRNSGEILQDVLGFEKSQVLSSTPSDLNLVDYQKENPPKIDKNDSAFELAREEVTEIESKDAFVTANDDNDIFSNTVAAEPLEEPVSDDDDLMEGETFLAAPVADTDEYDICLIVTETHLSERDSVDMKQKARWHFNVVKSCQEGVTPNEVQIVFDTQRSDRKSRTYYMEEPEKFIKLILERMLKHKKPEKRIQYQCIKCNETFSRTKTDRVAIEDSVTCPKCESTHVIETV